MSSVPPVETALAAAAIRHDGSVDVDALLWAVADEQRALGRRVHGLLMTYPEGEGKVCGPMVLVDYDRGTRYTVSQALGSGSSSCRADTQGFARASEVLRRALREKPDLVVVNRFGSLESLGGGFTAELAELMTAGIPLLTAVLTRYEQAWMAFTGGTTLLEPRPQVVRAWIDRVVRPAGRT